MAAMQSICNPQIEPKTKHIYIRLRENENVKKRLDGKKKRFRDPGFADIN